MDSRSESPSQGLAGVRTKVSGLLDSRAELISPAVRRDGLDPGFSANLSALGPVAIHDAGKFMRTPSQAQKTLSARKSEYTSSTQAPPTGYLAAPILEELFDRMKSTSSAADRKKGYEEYGVDPRGMEEIRRWVNSPSVGGEVQVKMVNGEEVREIQVSLRGPYLDALCRSPHTQRVVGAAQSPRTACTPLVIIGLG